MTRTRLTLTLLAAALCGCASKSKPTPVEVGNLAPGTFQTVWSAETGMKVPQQFHYVGETIFLYDKGNVVSAYDENGGLKFRSLVGENGDLVRPPLVQENRIIFPTGGALELFTLKGVKTKTFTLPQPVRSPGVTNGGDFVYFGSDSETGGRLSAIDLTRSVNVSRWTVLTGIITTQPLLFDNALYVATDDGRVYGINQDRTPLWGPGPESVDGIFRADGKIIAGMKADAGNRPNKDDPNAKVIDPGIYVASMDTKLYCLSPNTGRVRWTYFAGVPLTASPVVTVDVVYQLVDGQGIVALPKLSTDKLNRSKWTFAAGKQIVADDAKYAYVLTTRGTIAAVDKSNGELAFETKRNDIVMASTSLDAKDPTVFAITKAGKLVCIKPVLKLGVVGELAMLAN